MNYNRLLLLSAVVIAAVSLVASHYLVADLAREERQRMEIWAQAMHTLSMADEDTDLSLVLKVIENNNTIPVIVTDSEGHVETWRNVKMSDSKDSLAMLTRASQRLMDKGQAIKVETGEGKKDYLMVCYDDSLLLKRLAWYPYVQLAVMLLFMIVAIVALLTQKKAEQNKVWVGLSKETAHQLGTPISSLMAWTEILREQYPDDTLIPEMDKDVHRLQLIADRFSKIGSAPERKDESLENMLKGLAEYMARRTSQHVSISTSVEPLGATLSVNRHLFEWVLENLCKNAVDAMEGRGSINIVAKQSGNSTVIDVSDTGRGIDRQNIKKVFRPGFTTKKRGWGLGLSLARRIVEEYHHGRISVLHSEPGKGTTFRIVIHSS